MSELPDGAGCLKLRRWYLKAAEKDYAPAEANLGYIYAHGQGGTGVASDTGQPYVWLALAASGDAGPSEA